MLKGEDLIVLLKLASTGGSGTLRDLQAQTAIPRTVIHRSIGRLMQAGLLDADRSVNLSRAEEFLIHGMSYVFPPVQEGATRGIPTAWAAPPLKDELAAPQEPPPVWPDPEGQTRGIALQPLHPAATKIHHLDPQLAEQLALLDALRLPGPRLRKLAAKLLHERLTTEARAG